MRIWLHRLWSRITGKNLASAPPELIISQLNEPRPLPIGMAEFEVWADRIIAGAMIGADAPSLKFCLADMLLHLGPTESHKPDAHFIHCLRKFAVNQIAVEVRARLHAERKAALAEVEEANKLKVVGEPSDK